MIDANGSSERDEAAQIHERKFDAFRIEAAGRGDPAPQAAHDLLVEQWKYRGAQPLEDDEAQRVRAQIDDADPFGIRKQIPIRHSISARQASGDLAGVPCLAPRGSDSS